MMESFHFLRPLWLLALPAAIPILVIAWRRATDGNDWKKVCEPHLLRHLVATEDIVSRRWPLALLALGWLGACIALAGPTWERLPQTSFETPARTVFVLGLTPSMDSRDVAPSRIARARHKLEDAVDLLGAGSMALVVYREEAFAATPLTDDAQVLREIIPLLKTDLTPGSRVLPARGLDEARRLLEPVGLNDARILLVSDGSDDDPDATLQAAAALTDRGARVAVLGIAGDSTELEAIAQAGHGAFAPLRADDGDLERLIGDETVALGTPLSKASIRTDTWRDMGVWLVWIPLLLAPFAFRKGWLTLLFALLFVQLPTLPAEAGIREWFERPDQQGARSFANEEYEASAQSFEDPAWKAAARYRAGDFAEAATLLENRSDADSQYNLGNALARAGRLEEAVAAYDAALQTRPGQPDARFNRDLVKKLLDTQEPPPTSSGKSSPDEKDSAKDGQSETGKNGDASKPAADSENAQPPQNGGTNESAAAQDHSQAEDAESKKSGAGAADDQDGAERMGGKSGTAPPQSAPGPDDSSAESAEASDDSAKPAQATPEAREEHPAEGTGSALADRGEPTRPEETASGEPRPGATASRASRPTPREQAAAQWMAKLPDDPGGLLRERIRRDYVRKLESRR